MINFKFLTPAAVVLGVAFAASGASAGALIGGAGFTPVNATGGTLNNERCAVGTVASGGVDCSSAGGATSFANQESIASILSRELGGITRLQDFDGSVPGAPAAGANHTLDQLWSTAGKSVSVQATARYLGATVETLGYIPGTTPVGTNGAVLGAMTPILPLLGSPNQLQTSASFSGSGDQTITGDIKPITAGFVTVTIPGDVFRFAIATNIDPGTGDVNWTSFQGKGDGTGGDPQAGDHMIAFQSDLDPLLFVIMFDDQPASTGTDLDFNDTVFLVRFNVPEPASLTLFGMGLIGLGAFSRRRKAAKAA